MRNSLNNQKQGSTILQETLDKCRGILVSTFVISSCINLLVILLPIYSLQVLDRVLSSGSVETLVLLTVIVVFSFICSSILEVSRSIIAIKVGNWLDVNLTPKLVEQSISIRSIRPAFSAGEALRDFNVIKGFLTSHSLFSILDTPWSLMYLIVLFLISPVIGGLAVLGIFFLISMSMLNVYMNKKLMVVTNEETLKNIRDIDHSSRNSDVLEAMGMTRNIIKSWNKQANVNRGLNNRIHIRTVVITSFTKFFRQTLQIMVIGIGAYLSITTGKTAGAIIASSILVGRVLGPFEQSLSNWKNFSNAKLSYNRLQSMLLAFPKRESTMELPAPVGKIDFERVIYTPYNGKKPTIKGVSFKVNPGQIVGVIGDSASGKSTLAKLLVGVIKPISGTVRLDGADVYTWEREHFGSYIGYLPQDIELFATTVKNNIARFADEVDPEKVVMAAKIVGVHEDILKLPNGYDTLIEGSGLILSGGQKQRIGLARALYNNVKVLVLDEPNSNLDHKGDEALSLALKYLKENKITTFIMTHKLPILKDADMILVLQDGMLVKQGEKEKKTKKTYMPEGIKQEKVSDNIGYSHKLE
ncbi:MAG: alkaline protease secretion ATP-binding protein AprD [Candidatus Xenolissoclinum pacificiensis L6]|uniref:Alkaline protease secretion ATP-binding protein AprD n=1 Tax=Candidatus Xenolissoclinum pacificiensis L6 TaxID=1401685 RepID=W2V036_9RICK|nr:MAG: alkaline protease secretion ATP-binding protein AprD [Candidatus Xenolissoclinum pacificiensis L6]